VRLQEHRRHLAAVRVDREAPPTRSFGVAPHDGARIPDSAGIHRTMPHSFRDGRDRRRVFPSGIAYSLTLLLGLACGSESRDRGAPADGGSQPDAAPTSVPPPPLVAEPEDEAAYIYADGELRTYELRIAEADLEKLNANPTAEEYVPGTLVFEDKEYGPVGVRYKGSTGAFLGCVAGGSPLAPTGPKTCAKLSMKVSFDWEDPEGRFFGLKKLQFHSMRMDGSLLKERLIYWLYRQMDVPAPRSVHARLVINGKLEGLFALVEQIDGRFTRARFGEGGEGNLYKEVWPMHDDEQTYLNALETNKDESPSAGKMVAFARALAGADAASLPQVIDEYVDRDQIARYLAVDRAVKHFDGPFSFYCGIPNGQGNNPGPFGNHNYYWYEESDSSPLWLVPWDVDLDLNSFPLLGNSGGSVWYEPVVDEAKCTCAASTSPLPSLRPAMCDKLFQAFATFSGDYEAKLRELVEGPFSAESVGARLDAWSEQIASAVEEQAAADVPPTVEAWRSSLDSLRTTLESLRPEVSAGGG
jgi:hypothetical protein